MESRKPYPTDVTDEEWAKVAAMVGGPSRRLPATPSRRPTSVGGYTGERPATDAAAHGIQLEVVKLADAKRGFVLLPRRWVVERSFAWTARFRRLARDYERLQTTLEGFHSVAFALLELKAALPLLARVKTSLQQALAHEPQWHLLHHYRAASVRDRSPGQSAPSFTLPANGTPRQSPRPAARVENARALRWPQRPSAPVPRRAAHG